MNLSPIISAEELLHLKGKNLILVNVGSSDSDYENYLNDHLSGSLYIDLNEDLAKIPNDPKIGGRHPLPSLEKFTEVLQRLGIDHDSQVIIYDSKKPANASSRFWWMLKSAGIKHVQVLDGGFQMAQQKGLPINSEMVPPKTVAQLSLKEWKLPTVDIEFIQQYSENPDYLVVDVRDQDRYDGKTEPIDEVAGHIPGAINIPFKWNYNEDGTFKSPETLHEKYVGFFEKHPSTKIVVHCGSGVTACHTLLALDYAGFTIPNLYVGSWSDWSRNDKAIAINN